MGKSRKPSGSKSPANTPSPTNGVRRQGSSGSISNLARQNSNLARQNNKASAAAGANQSTAGEHNKVCRCVEQLQRWNTQQHHTSSYTQGKRLRSFFIRTISTVVLIAFFVVFVYSGHVPLMFMVLGIQVCMLASSIHWCSQHVPCDSVPTSTIKHN